MINLTKSLKQIDFFLGPALLKILPAQSKRIKPKLLKQILIIRPGGLGDALLLLPSLKAVSKEFKFLKIDVLCEPRNRQAFQEAAYINKILLYNNPFDLFSALKKKYDLIIDTEQSHYLSAITARLLRASLKSGFNVNARHKMYDVSIPYQHDVYEAENFWKLIFKTLRINKAFAWDFPYFNQTPTHLLPEIGEKKYVCIFTGASVKERLWPEKRWAEVINYIDNAGFYCVLIGGKKEIIQTKRILELCQAEKAINQCNMFSIAQTSQLLEKASLLISTDSGILHLGVLSDTPTLSLFGPGIAAKWGPKGKKHRIINKQLDCSPCTQFGRTPLCRNQNACMEKITSNDVIEGLREFGIF